VGLLRATAGFLHALPRFLKRAPALADPSTTASARPRKSIAFSDEAANALSLAARTQLEHPGDEERMVKLIVDNFGWSPARARWFLRINWEQLQDVVDAVEHRPEKE
jgi:hypothetical protein